MIVDPLELPAALIVPESRTVYSPMMEKPLHDHYCVAVKRMSSMRSWYRRMYITPYDELWTIVLNGDLRCTEP